MSQGDQLLAFGRPRSLISTVPEIKLREKKENSFGYLFALGEGVACFVGSGFILAPLYSVARAPISYRKHLDPLCTPIISRLLHQCRADLSELR